MKDRINTIELKKTLVCVYHELEQDETQPGTRPQAPWGKGLKMLRDQNTRIMEQDVVKILNLYIIIFFKRWPS